jgi:hypothetical protein
LPIFSLTSGFAGPALCAALKISMTVSSYSVYRFFAEPELYFGIFGVAPLLFGMHPLSTYNPCNHLYI